MRIPFAILDGVEVTPPSKSGNSLNAGIDFYIPTKGSALEFNPGIADGDLIRLMYDSNKVVAKETYPDLSDIKVKESEFLTDKLRFQDPSYVKRFTIDDEKRVLEYILYPGENVRVHSGVAIETDFGQFEMVCNRSGMASNNNIIVGAHIIDTGYSNELMFDIHNIGLFPVKIIPGMKITQMVVTQFISATPFQMKYEDLYKDMEQIKFRGKSGFGSTDKRS